MNSIHKILLTIFLFGITLSFAQEVAIDIEIPALHDRDEGNELNFSSGNQFPNFSETDIDGNFHDLYTYLDDGYTVVLNLFTYYCQPCEESSPVLDHFYQNYEYEYELVKVIGFETTSFTQQYNASISIPTIADDWNINYPVINTDDLLDQFESYIEVYPTYIVICPDKSYELAEGYSSGATLPFLTQNALECLGTDVDDDIDVLTMDAQRCESSMTLNIQFQNTGTDDISNLGYTVFLDNTPIDTVSYPCSLSEGDILITTSTYDEIPSGNVDVKVEANLDYQEDNLYNNELTMELESGVELTNGSSLKITITPDNFPEETAWRFSKITGEIIAQGGFDSLDNVIGVSGSYTATFPLDGGTCYNFEIFDTYGDGVCCGGQGNGYFGLEEITEGGDSEIIYSGGDFSYYDQFAFWVPPIGLEEIGFQNKIVVDEIYHDLLGRRLESPQKGHLHIRTQTFEDGSYHSEKIILE